MFDEPSALQKDLAALCRGMEGVGLSLEPLLAAAGLPDRPERLAPHQLKPQPEDHRALWSAALAVDPSPALPLRVGAAVPFGAYDVIDYLCGASPDVATAAERLTRYFGLITPGLKLELLEEGALRGIASWPPKETAITRVATLYTLGVTLAHLRHNAADPLRVVRVELSDPAPEDPAPFEAFFGGPTRFGALRDALWFSSSAWSAPLRSAEPNLGAILERHAQEAMRRRGVDERASLQLWPKIAEGLAQGAPPSLKAIAREVGLSPRTLQRRLAAEGTAFSEIVERVRRALAGRYLAQPGLSVAEVAWLLGYSEASAFVRAFERWTGTTPGRFRAAPGSIS